MIKIKRKKKTRTLLREVAASTHDFEWYPTSDTIIAAVGTHMKTHFNSAVSFLDCGAGNGKVLEALKWDCDSDGPHSAGDGLISTGYAIEKSRPLLDALDKEIFVVGTDFHQQTLIDKQVDVVFCNPPYSEWAVWAAKIIREANASTVYLVLPQRWKEDKAFEAILKNREADVEVLMSFDFREAEDRPARTTVDVLAIDLGYSSYRTEVKVDPFVLWFNDMFKDCESPVGDTLDDIEEKQDAEYDHDVVKEKPLIQQMEEFYQADMLKLINLYKEILSMNSEVLRELDVNKEGLRKALRLKIEGMKNTYWHQLFNKLTNVTTRLTSGTRKRLLDTLHKHVHVDFSAENAYAVVGWVIKQSNSYFDSQLITVFESLFTLDNVKNYKSNDRVFHREDSRWSRGDRPMDNETHYMLELRIIKECYKAIVDSSDYYCGHYETKRGLSEAAGNMLDDLATVGNNLGFVCETRASDFEWSSGKSFKYMMNNGDVFMECKAFKNGNLHIKFSQKFLKAFNVEFGRLKGWLRSKDEAANETGYKESEIDTVFESNYFLPVDGQLLLAQD